MEPVILEETPIPVREKGLADRVQAVQLMEHVQLDEVLVVAAGDPFRGVGQLARGRVGDFRYPDCWRRTARGTVGG